MITNILTINWLNDKKITLLVLIILIIISILITFLVTFLLTKRHYHRLKNTTISHEPTNIHNKHNILFSRLSHEIRTPLNAIIGYNTIAQEQLNNTNDDNDLKNKINDISQLLENSNIASKQLIKVLTDVLDTNAIETGKIKLVNNKFNFDDIIKLLSTVYYIQARNKNISFKVIQNSVIDEIIMGDAKRVEQIIDSLLSNAFKYTPDGGQVTLYIDAAIIEKQVKYTIKITDTGIGMSKKFIDNIWEPINKYDVNMTRRFSGNGFGLPIIKRLIELMNGNIKVDSKIGNGSTFTLEFSFLKANKIKPVLSEDYQNLKVLVFDQDKTICDYLTILFKRLNIRCDSYTSTTSTLEAYKQSLNENDPYTICLIDWESSSNNAKSLMKNIKSIGGIYVPIVIIMAFDFEALVDEATLAGANMFIPKPIFASNIHEILTSIIDGKNTNKQETIQEIDEYPFFDRHILIVEDNLMNMEIISKILEAKGFIIDKAWDGEQAITMFEETNDYTCDIILMDIQMPNMNGLEATERIRHLKRPDAKTIPIIAMTADVFDDDIKKALQVGMDAYLTKPIDVKLLFKTLSKFL